MTRNVVAYNTNYFLAVLGITIPKSVLLGQSQGVGRAVFLLEALGENLIAGRF